jgi:hypothetical protein
MKLTKLHQTLKKYGLSLLEVSTLEKIIDQKIDEVGPKDYQRIYKLRRYGFLENKKLLTGVKATEKGRDFIQTLYLIQ